FALRWRVRFERVLLEYRSVHRFGQNLSTKEVLPMILNVNDFGCLPDGRFLERASIKTGSAVLTDADGILRPTDVGKNIAIPGAADLVTTIIRLIDRGDVANVAMNPLGPHPNRLT